MKCRTPLVLPVSMVPSAKKRYLAILSLGVFAHYSPLQLEALHSQLAAFLSTNADSLDLTDLFDLRHLHFMVLLLTNRDNEARACLDRLHDQFGNQKSQKLMVLRLMLYEATSSKRDAIAALGKDANDLQTSRRLTTLARRKDDGSPDPVEYVRALTHYLDLQPGDPVAWAELGDQYNLAGHYDKAVYCFQEVLMVQPLAYNMFYKVGLNQYLRLLQQDDRSDKKERLLAGMELLRGARDAFLRAVELSDSYSRAWVGVYVTCGHGLVARLGASAPLRANTAVAAFVAECGRLRAVSRARVMELEGMSPEEFKELETQKAT